MQQIATASSPHFQPHQIVYLEHGGTRLYAEVIQMVELRRVCWVRPLMIVMAPSLTDLVSEQAILSDLRQGADLLWPSLLFQSALDTEVVPLLAQLQDTKMQVENTQSVHQQLSHFMRQVWQAHQSNFAAP